jgi:hypothetical protein
VVAREVEKQARPEATKEKIHTEAAKITKKGSNGETTGLILALF